MNPIEHADWIVITAFYQALHLIDAYLDLVSDGQLHPPAHHITYDDEGSPISGCNQLVQRIPQLKQIREHYQNLYEASREARYDAWSYREDADEVRLLLDEDLASIVDHIESLIQPFQQSMTH
ncbi:MAG: hypothetical protein O7E52_05170 [Candidatus Poribacteria bacterium]|nr:hypothetical protein [Candidatus Poribacteria bacterium]